MSESNVLESIEAVAVKAKKLGDDYRAKRDANFKEMEAQGYKVYAVDDPCHEIWVIDDRIFGALQRRLESHSYLPMPGGMLTGVRCIPLSVYEGPTRQLSVTELRNSLSLQTLNRERGVK